MAANINPEWMKEMKKKIAKGEFASVNLSFNTASKWLILYLANRNIPVQVVNLGGGVKRITIAEKVCPNCKGKGFV